MDKKGQVGGIVALVIGLVVAVILMVGVLIPIVTNVTGAAAFTGVNLTIANNLTTFILLGVLVLIAGIAIYGFSNGSNGS
jgi:hypothetical protein